MWVLIDNYDSFTYILHHYLLQIHDDVRVFRNDAIGVEELIRMAPERIILSPGPKTPAEAGVTNEIIARFHQNVPILGICLGHQALGVHFGAVLKRARRPVHGHTSIIIHDGKGPFCGLPQRLAVMRYHSLVITQWEHTDLVPLAVTEEGELMAFEHKYFPCTGMQFHPESVLTPNGMQLLKNWGRRQH